MRIVYLNQYFQTPDMSSGTRAYELTRRLVERGHDVHVVTSDTDTARNSKGDTWRVSIHDGVRVHRTPVLYRNSMGYRRRLQAFTEFGIRAARRAASLPQDLVFASSTPLTIAAPAIYSAKRRGVPMVFEVRDVWPEVPIALGALRSPMARRAALALERWAYQNSAHVIALSPGMADSISRRFPHVGVTIVSNGCDLEMFADADAEGKAVRAAYPWLGDRPMVLYAGAFGRANGLGYLVELAAALARTHPEVCLVLAGAGGQEDDIRRLAAERGVLGRNLFCVGEVSKREVVGLFGACDLAISSMADNRALWANSANKVFDALAAGRPVALNHEGWLADVMRETGAGIVLPAADTGAAAVAVADFLHDPDRVALARISAARLARDRFDRDVLFGTWERVLLNAVRSA